MRIFTGGIDTGSCAACLFFNEKLYHYYINPESLVMKKDQMHHMDIFYTTMMMWEECGRRGVLEKYPRKWN